MKYIKLKSIFKFTVFDGTLELLGQGKEVKIPAIFGPYKIMLNAKPDAYSYFSVDTNFIENPNKIMVGGTSVLLKVMNDEASI